MKALTEKIIHYLVLIGVTVFAVGVMWKLSSKEKVNHSNFEQLTRPLATVSAPKSPVMIHPLEVELCEITSTYAGKIQAWETYQIGFEVAGRVLALGKNAAGQPLDDGDVVVEGQVLALLDDRVHRARKGEATARVEQATADLRRAEQIRASNSSALTESELQKLVTDLALTRAQHEVASKNLEDATLRSPVDATISRRMIKSGESVVAHRIVFELVENENVLLVVDVPESHIRELEARVRVIKNNLSSDETNSDPEDRLFRAHVQLEGRDRFGTPWPSLLGEVYRIPEVADPRTGLFPVELRLTNAERLLRPGMVATADLVTTRIQGYQIPAAAVIFRQRRAHLFTVVESPVEMEMLYWNLGPAKVYRSQRIDLSKWIDQGEYIVLPADSIELDSVVTRGHFRLADNQLIRIINMPELSAAEMSDEQGKLPAEVALGRNDE